MACGLSPVDERVHAWLTLTVASWFLVSGAAAAAAAGGRAPGSLLGWLAHCHRLLLSPVHVFARPPACAPICGPNAAPTTPLRQRRSSQLQEAKYSLLLFLPVMSDHAIRPSASGLGDGIARS